MDAKNIPEMTSSLRVVYAGLVLIVCWVCLSPAAAFTVTSGPFVVPDERAVLGETVTADIEIMYDVSSMNEYITAYTDLGSASWDAVIIEDGREMPLGSRSGRYLTVTGFELYNPGSSVTKLQVHLEGVVPDYLTGAGEAEVLTLEHVAGDGSTILDSVSEKISIIDLGAVNAMRTETENDLICFEEEITAAYSAGTDTSAAEEAAADIRDLIEASRQMDVQNAYIALSEAKSILSVELSTLTDSITDDYFQDARERITAIEPSIAEYRDAGGADEQGILVVLSYRDNAEMLLVLAEEKNTAGDVAGAQQYAEDAYEKADDAIVYLAGMYTKAGLTLRGYTPDATSYQPSLAASPSPSLQTLSLPDFMEFGGEEGSGEIDVGGTITFFQVIIDGFWGLADIFRNVSEAFSGIGNK